MASWIRGLVICIIPPYERRAAAKEPADRSFRFSTARNKVGPGPVKYGLPASCEGSAFTTFRASTRFSPSRFASPRLPSPSLRPPPLPAFPSNYRVTNFARCKPRISPIGAPCQFKAILSASRSYLETFVSREMTSFRITSPLHASRSPSIFHRLIVLVDSFRLIAIEGRNRLLPFPLHCIRIHD